MWTFKNFLTHLKSALAITGTAVTTHVITQAISQKERAIEAEKQAERDKILKDVDNGMDHIRDSTNKLLESNKSNSQVSSELNKLMNKLIQNAKDISDRINSASQAEQDSPLIAELKTKVQNFTNNTEDFRLAIENILNPKDGKNLLPDFNLDYFYSYLDTLTLLEESSLLHIILFLIVLITLLQIFLTLLANDIIKFFKIEENYPSLSKFFHLRMKFQRYYLLINMLILIIICFVGIGVNILLFNTR